MKKRNLGISIAIIAGILLLTQYQNCGSSGSGLNLGNTNAGSSGGVAVNIYALSGLACNTPSAILVQSITGAGAGAKGCLEFNLTAPSRIAAGTNIATCTTYTPLSTLAGWTYNAGDTWSYPNITLKGNTTYVPGTYTVHIQSADGSVQGSATFVLATGQTPEANNCN